MNIIKQILIAFVLIASISVASATDVSGPITSDETWDLAGSPYNVTQSVIVLNDATLTINQGVTVNFAKGTRLWIGGIFKSGKLLVGGTPGNKTTFTGTEKTPGHWKGIVFGPTSDDTSVINNAIIEYGGHKCMCDHLRYANIILWKAAPTINGSIIRNSARDGILCIGPVMGSSCSTPTITCNWITNNINGIRTLSKTEPIINNNNICGNSNYGVLNNRLSPSSWIDATCNWWGSATGPTHSGNIGGTGDAVSNKVYYNPWEGQPVPCAPIPELSSIILVAVGILMLAGYARIKRRD
jgi:hypothetical protein